MTGHAGGCQERGDRVKEGCRMWGGVVESEVKGAQLCLLVTPWTTQSMEFSRPESWSGLPCPPPGDLPNPGIEPRSPSLQEDSLPAEPPGKPIYILCLTYIYAVFQRMAFT